MNSKCYIFITNGIIDIGGIELYLVNKINWLIENGWDTHIFSAAYPKSGFKIESLEIYRDEIFPILSFAPYECPYSLYLKTFTKMIDLLGNYSNYSEIIIESHSGSTALWGEQIARKVNAIHIMEPLHEVHTEDCYKEKRAFFVYKLNRGEIYGGRPSFVRDVLLDDPNKRMPLRLQYNPIMDIDDKKLNDIQVADYSICYLGRTSKPYYEYILRAVFEFAETHSMDTVQFVVVGAEDVHINTLNKLDKPPKNLKITVLGEMFPIPRKLFSMVDVVCAGAGSANAAVFENVKTIVPDTENYMANGVLGYDIDSPFIDKGTVKQTTICEAIENVLILKKYENKKFILNPPPTVNECCEETYHLIKLNYRGKDYYCEHEILNGRTEMRRKLQFLKLYVTYWRKIYG